jgi:hypothetical protein
MGLVMRLLLAILALFALTLVPLGMPAEARAMADHCAEMAGMDHHQQTPDPAGPQPVKSCCTAMPAALPTSDPVIPSLVLRAPVEALVPALQLGLRRKVEIPPPRA